MRKLRRIEVRSGKKFLREATKEEDIQPKNVSQEDGEKAGFLHEETEGN